MKTTFYLDGKKTTRKAVKEEDPMVQNDFFIGSGMLTIEFA